MIPTGTTAETRPTPTSAQQLADQIAEVVVATCPAVAGLAAGPVATYLPGRTVPGVAIRDDAVLVAVVAWYGTPLADVAEQVRGAVHPLVPLRRIDVSIDDLAVPPGTGKVGSSPTARW